MRDLIIRPGDTINLGRQGENIAEQVQFDVAGWSDLYGAGTYSLRLLRPGESIPYEAEVSTSGERVLWNVTETDTAIRGMGEAQLILTVGDIVAKTQIYHTMITPSIGGDPEPPDPAQDWFDQIKGFADDAEESALDAEAWAVGERGGQAVPQSDETYHNNAKFYADKADQARQAAEYAEGQTESFAAATYDVYQSTQQTAQDVLLYKGAPLVAATAAAMTDHNRVYVYVGSETGYTAGNWYYWNGSAWASGGVYNAIALQTDKTLSVADAAADAAAVGLYADAIRTSYAPDQGIVQGGINTSTGAVTSNSRRCRTAYIQSPPLGIDIAADTGFKVTVLQFATTASTSIVANLSDGWVTSFHAVIPAGQYIRLIIAKTDDTQDVTPGDCAGKITITALTTTDETLTKHYKAADAQTVGAAFAARDTEIFEAQSRAANLEAAVGEVNAPYALTFDQGYYWDSQTETAQKLEAPNPDYRAYTPIPVEPGQKWRASIYGASSDMVDPILIVDENYTILVRRGERNAANDITMVIPKTGAYILLCTTRSHITKAWQVIPQPLGAGVYPWAGKTVAIIGDSISTNGHYGPTNPLGNVPEIVIGDADIGGQLSAYVTYLDVGTTVGGHTITQEEIGTEITFTPVEGDQGKVVGKPDNYNASSTYVWWEVAADTLGFTPIPVSWSGSSITSHEADKNSYKTAHAWHPAQIRKCGIRTPGTITRTAPDVIIIYRGTNDFSHSPRTKLTMGYFESNIQGYPTTDFIDGSYYGYIEGLMMTVGALRQTYPSARIVLCTLNVFKRATHSSFPTRQTQAQGGQTLPMYNNAIRAAADYLGCGLIEFDRDGITFENLYVDGYVTDDPDTPTHPSDKGHKVMGNRAIMDLLRLNAME